MALLTMLVDLRRLHQWTLELWHGDHGWHSGSAQIAEELKGWCFEQNLPIHIDRATQEQTSSEDRARRWRYRQLLATALRTNSDVVTAHTATDRTEGVLLNMARGCDLQGLSNLQEERLLSPEHQEGPRLRRPFLQITRSETSEICKIFNVPIWSDPSNNDERYARNRIRHQVVPVLEELHPGSDRRIAAFSERMSHLRDSQRTLCKLALEYLLLDNALDRTRFKTLDCSTCRSLLAAWLEQNGIPSLSSTALEDLTHRICLNKANGTADIKKRWQMTWCKESIRLIQAE